LSEAARQLAALIRQETGNDLPEGRLGFLEEAARRRARSLGLEDLAAYVRALTAGDLRGEWDALASLLTIKESSFFRVPQQWERIRSEILPELARRRAPVRRLRFWSAACAAGEEPATLAILLAESPLFTGWDWSIVATDLDPGALAQARRGLYGDRAVAAVRPAVRARVFARRGPLWELDPALRAGIDYRRLNLSRPPFALPEERFDLILLRNVLIYFRPELQRAVVAEATRFLAQDGSLFLGGSETLWRIQDRLRAVDLGDCFCYRFPDELAPPPRLRATTDRSPAPAAPRPRVAPLPPPPALPEPPGLAPAERMVAAMAHLEADRLAEAEKEVAAALAADPSDPAVHALAGLVHDLAGRPELAADALRAALYLEPALDQVRLALAGCLRRLGEPVLAERQLREAIAGLERRTTRRLAALDGRLLPEPVEALRRARAALESLRGDQSTERPS
jgi:chemotaxis protein methyltransferase CheR